MSPSLQCQVEHIACHTSCTAARASKSGDLLLAKGKVGSRFLGEEIRDRFRELPAPGRTACGKNLTGRAATRAPDFISDWSGLFHLDQGQSCVPRLERTGEKKTLLRRRTHAPATLVSLLPALRTLERR
jgi:hypothetical protein